MRGDWHLFNIGRGYEMIDSTLLVEYNQLIFKRPEWNYCFIKNNPEILLDMADFTLQEQPEDNQWLIYHERALSQSNPWNCIMYNDPVFNKAFYYSTRCNTAQILNQGMCTRLRRIIEISFEWSHFRMSSTLWMTTLPDNPGVSRFMSVISRF